MSYLDLLKDPRWQKKRLEVLESADWKCSNCGDGTKTLHVHHKKYRRGAKPWEYDQCELVSLCESCHDSASVAIRRLDEAVDGIKILGDSRRIDIAIGYLRALRALAEVETILVETYEQAEGVGVALYGSSADEILERCNGDVFDPCAMELEITTPPGIRRVK